MEGWQFDGARALLNTGDLRGTIDLARPMRGISAIIFKQVAVEGAILGVSVEPDPGVAERGDALWQAADAYVRGADFVAAYREPLEVSYNLQVYWRIAAATSDMPLALDAIISIQTPLWEAHPCVKVRSELFGRPAVTVGEGLAIPGDSDWSYVEATRPGDFATFQCNEAHVGSAGACWRFGRQFMEKGVIRRLHIRGAVVPRGSEQAGVEKLRQTLLNEEPPLTT